MKPSQIAWLCMLAGSISTALLGENELLSTRAHYYITLVSVVTTAISGFMLQRPEAMGGEPPAYFVVREGGVLHKTDKRGFEQQALVVAQDMPQPLTPLETIPDA